MEPMAKNEDSEKYNAKTDDGNVDAASIQNQNLRRSSRKRHISAGAVESEENRIKRTRRNSAQNGSVAESKIIQTKKKLDDLPPEMLEAVLQKLPTSNLLDCRQINQKFNEIASRLMRKRADIELHFSHYMRSITDRKYQKLLVKGQPTSKSLDDLIVCLKDAKHFPITSFRFDDLNEIGNENMENFLSIWGTNIVALKVSVKNVHSDVGTLRSFLVKTISKLKKLQIEFVWERNPATIELFADSGEFRLPNLQVLLINTTNITCRPMIANILSAAPNLTNFYLCNYERWNMLEGCVPNGIKTDDLAMIQALNKIHCLKDLQIKLSEDFVRFLAEKQIDFKLESFALSLEPSLRKNERLKSSATAISNQLFHSSKDVIQTLKTEPLGWLGPDLIIPKMDNLRKLELVGTSNRFSFPVESEDVGMFSPPFEIADNFPNLKELTVNIPRRAAFIFQQLKSMPSIKVLRVIGKLSAECEENLLKATPNVTKLVIEENAMNWDDDYKVSLNFRLIANCLPKLQSLSWVTIQLTHHDLFHSLDAAITGLPVKFCEQMSKKFRDRESLSPDETTSYQRNQRTSSILDLKELKEFDVSFIFSGDDYPDTEYSDSDSEWFVKRDEEVGFGRDDVLYGTGFSKVSKFLAFDLMPNLNVRTHRDLNFS